MLDGLVRLIVRFERDERGLTAVIFGILFTVLFLMAAVVIDYSRALQEYQREQAAVDAAALAASHYLGLGNEDEVGEEVARRFFKANMEPGSTAEIDVDLDGSAGTVTAQARNDFKTTLIAAAAQGSVARDTMPIGARTLIVKGTGTIEVAMALDNSGSMSGTKIEALKDAAHDLVGIVFAGADQDNDVKVALVPFAASVNVGADQVDQGWIYQGPESGLSSPLFTGSSSRFDILSQMGRSWGGCVEARAAPYDTSDTAPDQNTVATMFVPMFAPDEPDDGNASNAGYSTDGGDSNGYNNNYIPDFGGVCPTPEQQCIRWRTTNGVRTCRTYGPVPIPVAEAQSRSCKYQSATPSTFEGAAPGPNALCTTPPILPLTGNRGAIDDAITNMVASGNTNISEGTMWAWRTISPGLPFPEGRSYDDQENRKVLIVMTDGDNVHSAKSQHNRSVYAAYGMGSQNRLGTTYTNASFNTQLNSKTLAACSNAKAQGITVYTVAFGTEISSTGLSLLRSCAQSKDHAFLARDETALIQAFQQIGREIAKLRVAS
ncbi:MAG: TadE/TadG family type IV pilus assembly protein [Hyphomicrobium sp.]|nr:TadE/TadG family type IV pilus assembly protein [Hyphomicrobium sp.]